MGWRFITVHQRHISSITFRYEPLWMHQKRSVLRNVSAKVTFHLEISHGAFICQNLPALARENSVPQYLVTSAKISTVSTWLEAHLASAHFPLFGLKVIIKYDVTQCDFCLGISPIPLFHLDVAGNALRAYAHEYSICDVYVINLWPLATVFPRKYFWLKSCLIFKIRSGSKSWASHECKL